MDEGPCLTESVVVASPALVPPPHGFGPLYDVENTFRSLCYGVSPTNAEWSSLNIVAVTWPQLEVAPADNRRLAQRDISDVSSMSVADSVRSFEERRPPSSAIHLFRLHVTPPPVWGADTNVAPIQPSLLPLCELRMQQQWDEQVSRANMDRLVDAFSIDQPDDRSQDQQSSHQAGGPGVQCSSLNVSPLSGWHAGMSQAGTGEQMRVASAPRCAWSADCKMLASGDSAGRFEIFQVQAELNSWRSVYHIDFDHPVVACLWLANARKYGISRRADGPADGPVPPPPPHKGTNWDVDPSITIRRLPFFGPRNTQGEYALVVATADGQLVLVYQRDEEWVRVVAALRPDRQDSKTAEGGPWSSVPRGSITHADMMLVSKKWIYLSVHRAGAAPTTYSYEPGAIPDSLKHDGAITAPMVEVYRIQVEFASDYSPRLFATPLVVQPIIAGAALAGPEAPRVTHLKLITALNPEVRPVEKNVLGENHYFPLLFVSLGSLAAGGAAATAIQVWRLEGAPHAQQSAGDGPRRAPPLRLAHMWTEQRQGLLLSVIANRAERQQLRYLFAKPSDKDYRTLMLTWADGRVETLRNYQDREPGADCFGQCVPPVRSPAEWVIGSVLSPHYTAYFQLVMRPHTVELGTKHGCAAAADAGPAHESRVKPDAAVACTWSQSHARFRLGWTPLVADLAGAVNAHVQAHCGDLLAVRILNKEDPTDLVAMLANVATLEENQPMPARKAEPAGEPGAGRDDGHDVLAAPMSRTLLQALFRACTLLAGALKIKALELDPLSSATPYVRRLLGAIMQAQFLAQHNIQATSLGLLLHVASVVETRVCIVHEHLLQITTPAKSAFDVASRFSPDWRRLFPTTAALVLWCIDLLVALTRDTYLYFNVRCADRQGAMRPLCEADDAGAGAAAAREAACTQCFTGEQAGGLGDSCLLPGWVPSRLALLFHRPTLDAVRSLLTFAARLEADMLQRIHILNNLPPNAAAIPEYADMLQSREMLLSAAQQLAHALEYLPVGMQRLKDFLVEVEGLYADDDACMSVAAQAMLVSTSAVAGPFRKYLPQVARSFARHVLEPDATQPSLGHPAVPAALVLHDTRWIGVLACRANASGLPDGATVFETPWRVELPVVVADPRLIDADEDTLVPAAEVAEWARERSAFERALDEDNVLFDIDDPGFIFFDTSASPDDDDPPQTPAASGIFAGAVSAAAAQAPVRITTKVPDFSDVVGLYTAAERMRITDDAADHMFSMPPPFDTTYAHAAQAAFGVAADAALGALPLGRPAGASRGSSCTSPLTTPSVASASLAPRGFGPDPAGDRPRQAGAQHFVPHYSSVAVPGSGGEAGAGWQFVSMPQCPKLHIPTLLAQHACSLAVLAHKRRAQQPGPAREPAATGDCSGRGMAYCIDWSRSEGVVIESTLASGLSGVAAAAAAAVAAAAAATPEAGHGKLARPSDAPGVDGMDVVQKTMLPAGAPVKLCLRCGHLARRVAADAGGPNDVMWIRRFDVLCVCGGSWIAL